MKFLICIGGVEPSVDTIRFGARIAKAAEADVSVLYVQPGVPHAVRQEISLAREKMSEWEIELPGARVLRAARTVLADEGLLRTEPSGERAQKHSMRAGIRGAYELHLWGIHGENIRLRLREGEIIAEVNKEIETDHYDLVILGASQKRRILQKLVQFVDCSMLIVKNPKSAPYTFLLCTDRSAASRRAETFAANLARALDFPVHILSVAKSRSREHAAMEVAERASSLLAKNGVRHSIAVRTGNVVEQIAALAREDTLIVMGSSRASELKKFLVGSKSSRVAERVPCPVLIVKQ